MLYKGSRYVNTMPYLDNNGIRVLTKRQRIVFNLEGAMFHRVKLGDTIDGLAYKYYKNAIFAWAIMDANPQYLSELDIKVGDVLTIPPFEEVVNQYGRFVRH